MDDILLASLRGSRDQHFILLIAGRISGVYGWKGENSPVAYQVISSTLIIHFDGSECLTISDATGVSLDLMVNSW